MSDSIDTPSEFAHSNPRLLTRHPWRELGISRASWFRLEGRPLPILLPGFSQHVWRIADLQRWINSLRSDRRPGRPIRQAKAQQVAEADTEPAQAGE